MNRLICAGVVLAGLSSLGLTPTGCTAPEDLMDPEKETAVSTTQPADPVTPVPVEVVETPAVQESEQEPPAGTGAAVALEIPTEEPAEEPQFAPNAFPPVMPDTDRHQRAWIRNDCLRCHETGVELAPEVKHVDLPVILLSAKCRTCHVLIPGTPVPPVAPPTAEEQLFSGNAFPPMIPASGSHTMTWTRDDCMLCHEDGTHGAPIIQHQSLPPILLQAKCRTCHVQVRAVEASEPVLPR